MLNVRYRNEPWFNRKICVPDQFEVLSIRPFEIGFGLKFLSFDSSKFIES